MTTPDTLALQFQRQRPQLLTLAYRMLGSRSEAEDAVQEAWLRIDRSDLSTVESLGGWITTVTSRICLDHLRARKALREEEFDDTVQDELEQRDAAPSPEEQALVAEGVGMALMIVLNQLAPAERVAFVLHDVYDLPFEDIGPIVGRNAAATRQLASRARRRVQGVDEMQASAPADAEVVGAYLRASRARDLDGLLAVLAPDVRLRVDANLVPAGVGTTVEGAENVARRALMYGDRTRHASMALVDGAPGILVIVDDQLTAVLRPTVVNGRITALELLGDPERLAQLRLALPVMPAAR